MLVYQKETNLYMAEIRQVDKPTTKYEATFITKQGVTPRIILQCGWQELEYAHKMINDRAKNTLKYNQETT